MMSEIPLRAIPSGEMQNFSQLLRGPTRPHTFLQLIRSGFEEKPLLTFLEVE
jgi:hypothetical protein